MKVLHYEKDFQYTDKEMIHVAKKVGKLATYCKRLKNEDSAIKVEVERRSTKKSQDEIKVVLLVELPSKVLKADSRKATVMEAIDRCTEKIQPQLEKFKAQHMGKPRSR